MPELARSGTAVLPVEIGELADHHQTPLEVAVAVAVQVADRERPHLERGRAPPRLADRVAQTDALAWAVRSGGRLVGEARAGQLDRVAPGARRGEREERRAFARTDPLRIPLAGELL